MYTTCSSSRYERDQVLTLLQPRDLVNQFLSVGAICQYCQALNANSYCQPILWIQSVRIASMRKIIFQTYRCEISFRCYEEGAADICMKRQVHKEDKIYFGKQVQETWRCLITDYTRNHACWQSVARHSFSLHHFFSSSWMNDIVEQFQYTTRIASNFINWRRWSFWIWVFLPFLGRV
jgi:hypothetical protein